MNDRYQIELEIAELLKDADELSAITRQAQVAK